MHSLICHFVANFLLFQNIEAIFNDFANANCYSRTVEIILCNTSFCPKLYFYFIFIEHLIPTIRNEEKK